LRASTAANAFECFAQLSCWYFFGTNEIFTKLGNI
jgi:hypothetical protein